MAGKPLSSPPTVLDILRRLRTLGFCLGLDASADDSGDKQPSSLFDRILSAFINEVHLNQEIRPIPVFLGGGKAVDLFALYREVFENGGCVSVTKNRLWDVVGGRIGFDSDGAGSSVKLIYFKYLDELNRCLGADFCSKERKCSSPDVLDSYKEEDFELKPLSGLEKNDKDGDGDDVVILDPVEVDRQFSGLKKRKRDPLVGMLSWLLLVARNPCDPSIGKITGDDGQGRKFAVGALFSQVLMARQAMFHQKKEGSEKRHPLINEESSSDDQILSSRKDLKSLKAHCQPDSSSEATTFVPKDGCARELMPGRMDHSHYRKRLRSSSTSEDILSSLPVPPKTDPVLLGVCHQAEVPDLMERASVCSNDAEELKWLGTQIWPPEKKVSNRLLIEREPICKGRQDSCGCQSPGSVECVGFHVREKRNRLKLELGPSFYSWKFDSMGEEVARSWTEDEELRFKAVVRLYPPSYKKNLFQQLYLTFPQKRRNNVVSYYFNVFLLRHRRYQNRETPESIDSD